mgnify:FL=1|tara:strand:+ start:409 stop:1032 length:624 start_codon:yes stop_codon:yes gene_type:complete
MTIKIKISKKPVEYRKAINLLENNVNKMSVKSDMPELVWVLKHNNTFTGGTSYIENDILDKSIRVIKTNRGGKITFHGSGQLIFYFVINLNNRKKDIRWFIKLIEKTIIDTLKEFKIKSFSDKKNIGIWIKQKNKKKKVGAIGLKIKKWIAFHGFSINLNVDLNNYKKIKPCGLNSSKITNLNEIKNVKFDNLRDKLIVNFINNLKN